MTGNQDSFTEEMLKQDLEERVGIHREEEGKGTAHRENRLCYTARIRIPALENRKEFGVV